jgi:hypothetical protein
MSRSRRSCRKKRPIDGWEITAAAARAKEGRKGSTAFDRLLADEQLRQDRHLARKLKGKERSRKRKATVYSEVAPLLEQRRLERERQTLAAEESKPIDVDESAPF